jgi:hypothetical protein
MKKTIFRIITFIIVYFLVGTSSCPAQANDSLSAKSATTEVHKTNIIFPDPNVRLAVLGGVVVLVGVLGLLLNEKRKRADRKIGI